MLTRTLLFSATSVVVLAGLTAAVSVSEAQALKIENFYPHQVPRGQATVIYLVIASPDAIEAAEITPAAGVTVSGITLGVPANARGRVPGGPMWSEMTIEVAPDAAPGERTLVLVMPTGRTAPATLTIPSHVPRISDLRPVPEPSRQSTVALQFAAADAAADLRESPYVWFSAACGGDPLFGVVHGELTSRDKKSGVVRVNVALPPAELGGGAAASRKCDLQVRVADGGGFESNSLRTTVDVKD